MCVLYWDSLVENLSPGIANLAKGVNNFKEGGSVSREHEAHEGGEIHGRKDE